MLRLFINDFEHHPMLSDCYVALFVLILIKENLTVGQAYFTCLIYPKGTSFFNFYFILFNHFI